MRAWKRHLMKFQTEKEGEITPLNVTTGCHGMADGWPVSLCLLGDLASRAGQETDPLLVTMRWGRSWASSNRLAS